MSAFRFRSSRPTQWISPHQSLDAHQRYHAYGPIVPMDEPRTGLLKRLLGTR